MRLYREDIMKPLVEGFEQVVLNPSSVDMNFLKTLMFNRQVLDKSDYLLATAPIRSTLYTSTLMASETIQKLALERFRYLCERKAYIDDLIFTFTKCCNLGCFGYKVKAIYEEFLLLCSILYQNIDQLSKTTLKQIASLRDQIETFDRNRFILDFGKRQTGVLPPLYKAKVTEVTQLAEGLANEKELYHWVQSEDEALTILRSAQCIQNHVEGYETITVGDEIFRKCILSEGIKSSYIITNWFYQLCKLKPCYGALTFYLSHQDVLRKPHRFPTFNKYPAINFMEFQNIMPTRLAKGIAINTLHGDGELLCELFAYEDTRFIVDNEEFARQLARLLNSKTSMVAETYAKFESEYVELFENDGDCGEKQHQIICTCSFDDEDENRLTEEEFVRHEICLDYDCWYDDRGFLEDALRDNPLIADTLLIDFGYRYHPGFLRLAMGVALVKEDTIPKRILEKGKNKEDNYEFEWCF